jgi:hypothetical protein
MNYNYLIRPVKATSVYARRFDVKDKKVVVGLENTRLGCDRSGLGLGFHDEWRRGKSVR